MDKEYWLARKRVSLKAAQNAISADSRLIHYDLAGRYSVKAAFDKTQGTDAAEALSPVIDADHSLDCGEVRFDV